MKVTRQSYGNKILNSFVGVLIGIVMIIGSFVVLYYNEGRENLGSTAASVQEITQESTGIADGTLICIKGKLDAVTYADDDYLKSGNYLIINRQVEMYAYVEKESSSTHDNFGGSSTTTTTYSYDLDWVSNPKKTSTYQGDSNEKPTNIPVNYDSWIDSMPDSSSQKASGLKIGKYTVNDNVTLSGQTALAINDTTTDLTNLSGAIVANNYIYKANQNQISAENAELGDIRISYTAIKQDEEGVLIGKINGNEISAFTTEKNNTLFRFFAEADSKDQALSILNAEHKTTTWILRLVGWLLMFIGLMLLTNPISTFLSVIPVFSHISGFLFGVIAFFVSLILTSLTIILSIILHNFWYAMICIGIIVIITLIIISKKRSKSKLRKKRA